MSVDIICLRNVSEPKQEIVNHVNVYRIPLKRKRGGKLYYVWEYLCFITMSFFTLSALHFRKHYSIIHVHNMPDILVFSSFLPHLCGSKIILDLHDPMPEVFMAKYFMKNSHPIIRLLRLQEKYSIKFSDLVLTPNIGFLNLFIARGCPRSKINVIMNSPQESIFIGTGKKVTQNVKIKKLTFVLMYHGTIVERNGLSVALEALALIQQRIPNITFHVYGEGDYVDQFQRLVIELGLKDIVHYHGYIPLEKIALAIQSADVGIIPNKQSVHWEYAMPTRIFEYLILGKPVIVPRTQGILDYFDDESLYFFESGNPESLAEEIMEVYSDPERRYKTLERGMEVCRRYCWNVQRHCFVELVKGLLGITSC
jgi:glycosyltransferase involved in cell wall biosynthesis